jgi:hypothetical protein
MYEWQISPPSYVHVSHRMVGGGGGGDRATAVLSAGGGGVGARAEYDICLLFKIHVSKHIYICIKYCTT